MGVVSSLGTRMGVVSTQATYSGLEERHMV